MPSINPQDVLIAIPAFNAETHLEHLITRITNYIPRGNIIVVDDGSTDTTRKTAELAGVKVIPLPENRGKGQALKTAFRYAIAEGYRAVMTLDADLQHPPENIPDFMECYEENALVLGCRRISLKEMPLDRWLSNNLTSLIVSVFSRKLIRDSQCGFRMYPVSFLKRVSLNSKRFDLESEILFKAGALGVPIFRVTIPTVYNNDGSHIRHLADTFRFARQTWFRLFF